MKKYVNGYAEKIGYWQYKLNKAVEVLDSEGVTFASSKIAYFVNRQKEVYGKNIIAGVDFSDSLEALNHLGRS
jgi:hypothetical protein